MERQKTENDDFDIMFNWFKIINTIDDATFLKLNGVDYTMYIIFVRYVLYLMCIFSVFAVLVLWPFYIFGAEESDLAK